MSADELLPLLKTLGLGGFALLLSLRFLRWGIEFTCGRLDTKQAQLNKQEARIDASLASRLDHLESQAAVYLSQAEVSASRIRLLEQVVGILTVELRQADPLNPKIKLVGAMLAFAIEAPTHTPEDMMEMFRKMQ